MYPSQIVTYYYSNKGGQSPWILATGVWRDEGLWLDDSTWLD